MSRNSAIQTGKAQTDGRCVFTGTIGVDGAHFYPAGDFTALADVPENIFAMNRDHHSVRGKPCFDFLQRDGVDIVRPISQRRWILENLCMEQFKHIVHKKIRVVSLYCNAHDIEFPDSQEPEDYRALIYQGRLS